MPVFYICTNKALEYSVANKLHSNNFPLENGTYSGKKPPIVAVIYILTSADPH
jgi:hypothetical protein